MSRMDDIYRRESAATAWFVAIIVSLALLAIGYLIFAANTPSSQTPVGTETPEEQFVREYEVFKDPITGCQYFWRSKTPRYNADGTILCN